MRPSTAMRRWLHAVTPDEARAVAKAAGTSVPHLRHIAAGRRGVSADLAQRLAHVTAPSFAVPHLDPRTLCVACSKCPLAN
jgi:hypothetical protein